MKLLSIRDIRPLFWLPSSCAIWTTLAVLVGATFSQPAVAITAQQIANLSQTEVDRQCSPEVLDSTGKYAEFNRKQCRWAQAPLRTAALQKGDTCTCEVLLNAAFELGILGTIADLEKSHKCDGGNFGIFGDIAKLPNQPLHGRVLGGLFGFIANKKLTKEDTALEQLVNAVSEGHIVAVGLNAKQIYSHFANRHKVGDPSSLRASHALLVRALLKDQFGKPIYFVAVDSSGPHRRYLVPYVDLVDAYGSWLTILSRGVYISNKKRV